MGSGYGGQVHGSRHVAHRYCREWTGGWGRTGKQVEGVWIRRFGGQADRDGRGMDGGGRGTGRRTSRWVEKDGGGTDKADETWFRAIGG